MTVGICQAKWFAAKAKPRLGKLYKETLTFLYRRLCHASTCLKGLLLVPRKIVNWSEVENLFVPRKRDRWWKNEANSRSFTCRTCELRWHLFAARRAAIEWENESKETDGLNETAAKAVCYARGPLARPSSMKNMRWKVKQWNWNENFRARSAQHGVPPPPLPPRGNAKWEVVEGRGESGVKAAANI